jgi:hypothetical protein
MQPLSLAPQRRGVGGLVSREARDAAAVQTVVGSAVAVGDPTGGGGGNTCGAAMVQSLSVCSSCCSAPAFGATMFAAL